MDEPRALRAVLLGSRHLHAGPAARQHFEIILVPARVGFVRPTLTFSKYERLLGLSDLVSGVLAVAATDRSNVTIDGMADEGQVKASIVSGNYFSVLGVGALVGRTLTEDDDRIEGGHPVTVISYGYWERRFGRSSDAIGKNIAIGRIPFTIIGITRASFSGRNVAGNPADFVLPMAVYMLVGMLELSNPV